MTEDHTIEQSLEEILRRLDIIASSLVTIMNYYVLKAENEFDTRIG